MKLQVTYADKDKTFHKITDLNFVGNTITWLGFNGDSQSYDKEQISEIILDGEMIYITEEYEKELQEEQRKSLGKLFKPEEHLQSTDDVHPNQLKLKI